MITTSDINTILGIKENFQLHGALKDILFDEDKKTEVFEKFLEIENDLSYDWFTNYFQTNLKFLNFLNSASILTKLLNG